MDLTGTALHHLGHRVAADGVEAHWADIAPLVAAAGACAAPRAALEVLADPAAPAVARQRAFGLFAGAVSRADDAARPRLSARRPEPAAQPASL